MRILFLKKLSRKERLIFFVLGIVFAISFTARISVAVREGTEESPVKGGRYQEGVLGQPTSIIPFIAENPTDQDLVSLIFSSIADLASSVEKSAEGPVYSVKIREEFFWSDGELLTSDDIIFTVGAIQETGGRSPLARLWEGVVTERVSELQVDFILPGDYVFFPRTLMKTFVAPEHIFKSVAVDSVNFSAYNLEPVGSGPYKFGGLKRRKDGFITEYNLRRNDKYDKDQKPFINEIDFVFFENQDDLISAFDDYKIDGFGSAVPLLKTPKRVADEREIFPMSRYYAVFFNPSVQPALKDSSLRRFLRDRIRSGTAGAIERSFMDSGIVREVHGPMVQDSAVEVLKTKTKELKEDARAVSFNLIVPEIDFLKSTAGEIKKILEDGGIGEVKVLAFPLDDVFNNVIKINNYEMVIFGNILENQEDLFPFWHSSQRLYPGLNLALYNNSEADQLMEEIRKTEDNLERRDILKRIENIIEEDAPAAFLYYLDYAYYHTPQLKGLKTKQIAFPYERFYAVKEWHLKTARMAKKSPGVSSER